MPDHETHKSATVFKLTSIIGHIWPLLDIPTHTLQFFPTPVFHPISDYGFDGTRWSDPVILVPNVLLLAGLWFYVLRRDRKHIAQAD